ncbi:putative E3 ubiquitin-protein ligase RNF217 [Plecturocebus cupreus]
MGEEQSTVSGGGGPRESQTLAGGTAGHPEPPSPQGDSAWPPPLRAASAEPSGGGCGSDWGCADTSAPEPARSLGAPSWRQSRAPAQPAGLALAGPLNPQTLRLQLELEEEEEEAGDRREGGDEQQEAPPGEDLEPGTRAGAADGLVLDVLGQRRPPLTKRQVFCSVYCVESDLPQAPASEQLSPPASPPGAPPVPNPPSTRSSFPSPRLSLPTDSLSPDGGSIELEFYLAPEPFSMPSLLGAPPYSGLGGVGDPYAPLMVLMCRVCLEDKPIKPLPCCKKAVCEECLKIYLSAQDCRHELAQTRRARDCFIGLVSHKLTSRGHRINIYGADWEIPCRGATRVASVTLLASAAVLPVPQRGASRCGVYGTDGLGWSHPHKKNSNWKR